MKQWRNTMSITNKTDVPLALAVGLLADYYDYVPAENYISATTLLKPIKQVILSGRAPEKDVDLIDNIHTFLGSSIHASLEKAWLDRGTRSKAMALLGYKESVIEALEVNPEVPTAGAIQVYVEPERRIKELEGWKIGGRPDLILDGVLHDYKSTSTYKWTKGDFEDYRLQGSIYRWLYPDLIKEDFIRICFIFKDWKAGLAESNNDYPNSPAKYIDLQLMSYADTESWIRNKIKNLKKHINSPESSIPDCRDDELWIDPPTYKYYSNPAKTDGRSQKNFTDINEANAHLASQGKGTIVTVLGTPKRCLYCAAFDICEQRKKYFQG